MIRDFPSGAQSAHVPEDTLTGVPPSLGTRKMPSLSRMNAICLPSGDQVGKVSANSGVFVIRFRAPPSTVFTHISAFVSSAVPLPEKVMKRPSGDMPGDTPDVVIKTARSTGSEGL